VLGFGMDASCGRLSRYRIEMRISSVQKIRDDIAELVELAEN
jgi:hypothetical protein